MPYQPWMGRLYGAEFETNRYVVSGNVLDSRTIVAALQAVRPELPLNARQVGYYHSDGTTWDVKTDSSCGWEIASPALQLDETGHNEQLRSALAALQSCNPQVNHTCGTHVHVDCSDFDWQALRRLVILWSRYEPFFFELMPPARRQNGYCHPIRCTEWDGSMAGRHGSAPVRRNEWPHISRAIRSNRESAFREAINNYAGRGALNLGHWWRNGRVEFRLHAGTIDYMKITRWMMLLGALVKRVVNPDLPTIEPTQGDGPVVTLPTEYICRQLGLLPSRVCPDVPQESLDLVAWLDRRRRQFTPGAGQPSFVLPVAGTATVPAQSEEEYQPEDDSDELFDDEDEDEDEDRGDDHDDDSDDDDDDDDDDGGDDDSDDDPDPEDDGF